MNILIADSGGSGTSWAWSDGNKKIFFETGSWHPLSINDDLISATQSQLASILNKVDVIYFYGAGISSNYNKIKLALGKISTAITIIQSDIKGACIASLGDMDGFCSILGTGAIACEYIGGEVTRTTSGRGHILGDQGSGYDIGKRIITVALENPNSVIAQNISNEYSITQLDKLLDEKDKFGIAQITKSISKIQSHPEVQYILNEAFEEYFLTAIQPLDESGSIHLTGSIAYYYENEIVEVLKRNNWTVSSIIQSPISAILDYHLDD